MFILYEESTVLQTKDFTFGGREWYHHETCDMNMVFSVEAGVGIVP